MKRTSFLLIPFLLVPLFFFCQVPLDEIVEDKNDMADTYYGTFKYQGEPFTGKAISYYESGKIKSLRHFENGMYQGIWSEWYENGNLKFQGDRYKNMGDGLTRWWYENGQLKKQGTYDLDKQQGAVVRWHPNGNLKIIRYYEQDAPTGSWSTFDEEGLILDEGDADHKFYRSFLGDLAASGRFEDTSPTFTKDGNTMVFARYADWMKKVPHMATKTDEGWSMEQMTFADSLYNLAISPDGKQIVYKTFEYKGEEEITRAFISSKSRTGWSEPIELKNLYNTGAGYFQIMEDGTLFYFARKPKKGIYYSEPDKKQFYSKPKWFDDAVGLEKTDSFDVLMHPNQDKLIITQAYGRKRSETLGEIGMYYYEKQGELWKRMKRIPLGYAWGASIINDNFIFVRNGKLQYVSLKDIGIKW